MQLANRVQNLESEVAFQVLEEVKSLTATGKDIISLAIGEPDFTTPEIIKEAGITAIENNKTGYSPSAGIPELRQEVANYLNQSRQVNYGPEETIVAPGAKPLIFYALMALVEPGQEVIYPNPGFPIYETVIEMMGGIPRPLPLRAENKFSFAVDELKNLLGPKTAGIILNSPHNPTGSVIPEEQLAEIAEIIKAQDLWAISDEVYSELVYDRDHNSLAEFSGIKDRLFLIDGFSKSYAMTGWRIGFGAGSEKLIKIISKLITNSVSCTATFTQHAALKALKAGQDSLASMVTELNRRRDFIWQGLNSIKGFKCQKPAGAFYAFVDVSEACQNLELQDAQELQRYLLDKAGVAVLHRECFGSKNRAEQGEFLRISYANRYELLEEAIRRIKNAVEIGKFQIS